MASPTQHGTGSDRERSAETEPLLNGYQKVPVARKDSVTQHASIEDDVNTTDGLSTCQLAAIMSSTWLGIVLAALDGTMVATLTASISASYRSLSLLAWLAASYFIAASVLQPLSGKLTDIYGRRAGLIFSNIVFGLGNLICGVATNQSMIIVGRVVSGLGGGGLNAIPLFIASDLVPLRRRGVWQGVNNVCFGLGSGLGGVFGGWMNDILSWRWAFLSLVPLTLISTLMVATLVRIPETVVYTKKEVDDKWKRIDFAGSLTLVVTIVLFSIGLNSGGNTVPWSHPLVLATLITSMLFFTLFVYVELRVAQEPIIPLQLFSSLTVTAGCLTNWFMTMAQIALTFYAAIYFQVRGQTAFGAGIRLVPTSVGAAVGAIVVGIIMRSTGRYYVLSLGVQILELIMLGLTTRLDLHTPDWQPVVCFFFTGAAYAGMLTISVTALIAAVEQKHHAVVTSATFAFRGTGSTIGISLCSLVFQNKLRKTLWERFGQDLDGDRIVGRLRDSLEELNYLSREMAEDAREAYMEALTAVFSTIFVLAILAAMTSLFVRQHTLHKDLSRRRA